jgi:outer membrane protein OmpA-like peptidoglycan-associated protein
MTMRRLRIALAGLAALIGATSAAQPPTEQPAREVEDSFESTQPGSEDQGAPPQFATLPAHMIRGVRTHSELVSDYHGSEWYSRAAPVGLLEVRITLSGNLTRRVAYPCTAWLVRRDLVLTAYHCMPGVPRALREEGEWVHNATVTFDFDGFRSGAIIPVRRVIDASAELDFALLKLDRDAPASQGVIRILGSLPDGNAPLYMYHHPYGAPLMVLKDATCRLVRPLDDDRFAHQCDTRGGSSGAPVLTYALGEQEEGGVAIVAVGLHTTGLAEGLRSTDDFNQATSMAAIVRSSRTLERIACNLEPSGISCPPLYPLPLPGQEPAIVYFAWDSDVIADYAAQRLDEFIARLAEFPDGTILLAGHTDRLGAATYNVGLSQRMANNVRDYLVQRGVAGSRVTTEAYGESRPAVETADDVREPENRRVEIRLCREAC